MKKFTLNLKKYVFFSALLVTLVFSGFKIQEEHTVVLHTMLNKYHDMQIESKLIKRFELTVTNTGFCRYRKIYANGKNEYFAFNLSRFKSMDYYGTIAKGELYLRTKNDDVIVQTRNDRKGEVDSTSAYMVIPLKNISEEELNLLAENFKQANTALLASVK